MSSHIDCDDLLVLAAASCSVEEQFNADLRNQLSMSLLCHIAQASASHHAAAAAAAATPNSFAPATTPTTSSFTSSSSNAWMADETFYNAQHQHRRRREPSMARAQSRYHTIEESNFMEDSDMMQMEQDDVPINAILPHNGGDGRLPGKHSEFSESVSLFATSDPFYLAVQEVEAASRCRRQLQPKAFSVSTPMQVTPNPVQFGSLSTGQSFAPHYGLGTSNAGSNFDRRGPATTMPIDASLMQYR
ncbi:hypothetical protein M408DRAFT_222188 [Serendipita vermifera MAFF 305830]|uniref:Uncharacterized protein n=1 Tax=Serendipita vermifera MAFF 305830 TaxID=933852 RepID=A0A0C3B128_SERVB|nr:hypothetical protein M408DRAFT_222188 [Serendipita vermifera MAFF 305830]